VVERRWATTLSAVTDLTRSSTFIAAGPAAVMRVIADFSRYPEWVTFLKDVEILDGADDRARLVRFVLDAGVISDDYTLAYEWSDDEVSWHLVRGTSIKAMDGSYRLTPSASGTDVDYALSIEVDVPLLGVFKKKAERVLVDTALKALKARVETQQRGHGNMSAWV
jgi:ribosome-associated toxin RatA of RatAB toxin-antitoxin module